MRPLVLYFLFPYRRRRCAAARARLADARQLAALARAGLADHPAGSPAHTAAAHFLYQARADAHAARRAIARYCTHEQP